tara:strand:+ start:10135 stop:12762 length:2628 start_codon:yes stop_codon:yes gene_type:complete
VKDSIKNKSTGEPPLDRYSHNEIEEKWHKVWEKNHLYKTQDSTDDEKTFYALSMFPYPSGTLHMGHVRNYVITDVIARSKRMSGYKVLHPMGWDAFGLPAENAAIERGIDPNSWTKKNIKQMKGQLNQLGLSVDWTKEINTCDKDYYKWTQFIFLELYKQGLAYQQKATVNWDPIDKTVLANEQVDAEGKSWRSGAQVEKKKLNQWFLSITKYANELENDLKELKGWPEKVKTMQSNWIGKSIGTEIVFKTQGSCSYNINIFTTRPDTIYGVKYIVLSPNHHLVDELVKEAIRPELEIFRKRLSTLTDIDIADDNRTKNGLSIGACAINPINNEKVPIWIADYVLSDYGTGAVMGVPAHDERDFIFAEKYKLPIKYVIKNINEKNINEKEPFIKDGTLINSERHNGISSKKAKKVITDLGIKEGWANIKVQYKLRDWLISRQRYWGCPIPIIHCNKCGIVAVPQSSLPVELPKNMNITGKGDSPLIANKKWRNVECPTCGAPAQRETDTMDTFICSSWYFLRYADSKNRNLPFDKKLIDKWLPVDQYVGGIEHAILHLLYSRFITKALMQSNLTNINEPFKKLLTQGMVQGVTYKNSKTNKYIPLNKIKDLNSPKDPDTDECLDIIYEKMSKSKYNGIEPAKVIDLFGADTARMFILFKAPPEKDLEWDDSDVEGQYRFIQKIYKVFTKYLSKNEINFTNLVNKLSSINNEELSSEDIKLRKSTHTAINEISNDLNNLQFNTAISELMILLNSMNELLFSSNELIAFESLYTFSKLLAPFAPHLAEEIWELLSGDKSIHLNDWPQFDKQAVIEKNYNLVIQINGKVRGKLTLKNGTKKEEIELLVLNEEITKKWINNKKVKRIIIVPGKLANVVV